MADRNLIDLFLIFPLAILISRTGAYKELTIHQPTAALISCPIILSLLLQAFTQFSAQLSCLAVLKGRKWYTIFENNPNYEESEIEPNAENTVH